MSRESQDDDYQRGPAVYEWLKSCVTNLIITCIRKLSPEADRKFAIECRAPEIGGIRVMILRRLEASQDPEIVSEANQILRKLREEEGAILAKLSPGDRLLFRDGLRAGEREAQRDLREQ